MSAPADRNDPEQLAQLGTISSATKRSFGVGGIGAGNGSGRGSGSRDSESSNRSDVLTVAPESLLARRVSSPAPCSGGRYAHASTLCDGARGPVASCRSIPSMWVHPCGPGVCSPRSLSPSLECLAASDLGLDQRSALGDE